MAGSDQPSRIQVKMFPAISSVRNSRGGIPTVIRAYHRYADDYGIEFVDSDSYDLSISHAGLGGSSAGRAQCEIAMLHGIYFTAEYAAKKWEMNANRLVIDSINSALSVTTPSDWVAATLRREFKIDPYIIQHGVDFDSWQHSHKYNRNQVFWGKNRIYEDVCDPTPLAIIANRMPDLNFVTTLSPENSPPNVKAVGLLDEYGIREAVQKSAIVLSTIRETWGILYMESMAAGTPVVTTNVGHVPVMSPHGVAGYTYMDGSVDDMERGIRWAIENRSVLSENSRHIARQYSWDKAMTQLRQVLDVTRRKKDAFYSTGSKKTSEGAANR